MTDQHLAEKRSLRALKRRRIIAGRMQVFGSPYIPDRKLKRTRAVIDFRGYKEPFRDILPPPIIGPMQKALGESAKMYKPIVDAMPERKPSWRRRLLAKIFGK
jgi:hypothetical protein